jgi:hypothetical protein
MRSSCRIIALLSGAGAALAQAATLVGGVADSSRALIVGTIVMHSNEAGTYTFTQRPVSRYSVATVQGSRSSLEQ